MTTSMITSTDSALAEQLFDRGNDLAKIASILGGETSLANELYAKAIEDSWTYGGELTDVQKSARKALADSNGSIAGAAKALGKNAPTNLTLTAWAKKYGWKYNTRSRSRLTTDQWLEIRSRWENGEDIEDIAKDFPIKAGSISVKAYNKNDRWDADARRAKRPTTRGRAGMDQEEVAKAVKAYATEMQKSGNQNLAIARAVIATKGTRSAQSVLNNVRKAEAELAA